MARRISTGRVGKNVLGSLNTSENTISSVVTDDNIILDPAGAGDVLVESDVFIQDGNILKLGDSDSSNWIGFKAPATVASDVTLTFPATAGTDGYVLTTNGSGTLTWSNVAVQVADDISTDGSTAYYPLFTSATSGGITGVKVVTTKFEINANDGTLKLKNNTSSTSKTTGTLIVTGGTGISGALFAANTQVDSLGVGTASSGTAGEIRASNAVTAYYSSDARLKENITNISDALTKVSKINGVEYDWTDEYIQNHGGEDGYFVRKHDVGLIAQEVEQILPEIVAENNEGYKAIKYERVVALLVEAVKELKAEIEDLKK